MPSDVKAILSLMVAIGFAFWESSVGNGHLF